LFKKSETKPAPPQKRRTEKRQDGTLVYVTGSMGSGKTSWVRQRVAGAPRLLVWDGKGIDWGPRERCTVIESPAALHARLFSREPQRLSYRVPVSREHFETFCSLAWTWGRLLPGVIVVDEIADVTTVGKAPPRWGEIARKVRAYGTDVYVTTQRPQECDKTAQGNAMLFHCGLMADADDQAYVARRCLGGVPLETVANLAPLDWIERDVRERKITQGTLRRVRSSKR
jgi:hypothetical protein